MFLLRLALVVAGLPQAVSFRHAVCAEELEEEAEAPRDWRADLKSLDPDWPFWKIHDRLRTIFEREGEVPTAEDLKSVLSTEKRIRIAKQAIEVLAGNRNVGPGEATFEAVIVVNAALAVLSWVDSEIGLEEVAEKLDYSSPPLKGAEECGAPQFLIGTGKPALPVVFKAVSSRDRSHLFLANAAEVVMWVTGSTKAAKEAVNLKVKELGVVTPEAKRVKALLEHLADDAWTRPEPEKEAPQTPGWLPKAVPAPQNGK